MNILVIYPNGNALYPHSGAETRIWNLNKVLIENNHNVIIFHSKKSKGKEDVNLKEKCKIFYNRKLNFKGFSDFYFSDLNPFFIITLFHIFHKYKIDIIQFEFPWGFIATKLLKKKKQILIYDSQGIESEFIEVAAKNPRFPTILKPFVKYFGYFYEKYVCKLADVIINVSEVDRYYYINNYKVKKEKTFLIQTPSALSAENFERNDELKKNYRKKLGLPLNKTIAIFHGGLPHPPNKEAFDLIENYIAPKFEKMDILFVLAGFNVLKFKKKNIISLGFVDDLRDLLYSADFAIVPIISGSGMRIKCTDYIITALPFITTKIGIQGIDFIDPNEDYLVYERVNDEFIQGIDNLSRNKDLRQKLHLNLLKKSNFLNRKKFGILFCNLYYKLLNLRKED